MGDLLGVTVTPVQPYAARKEYICPGCQLSIPPGTFHLVVVPDDEPDLRRHWHQGCWHKEMRRRFGAAHASRR
ncbi:MAG TPA: hypothetical protein VGC03_09040 [Acidimicrobiia bacterium]|jgi:hypothetical protein|nr:hypothetical protein [Acidimicrobiia bacterium]